MEATADLDPLVDFGDVWERLGHQAIRRLGDEAVEQPTEKKNTASDP